MELIDERKENEKFDFLSEIADSVLYRAVFRKLYQIRYSTVLGYTVHCMVKCFLV